MQNKELTKEELNEICGGLSLASESVAMQSQVSIAMQSQVSVDIFDKRNINKSGFCNCTFNDHQVIKNINTVSTCTCTCH
jgi:hypothetical protein